MANELYKVIAVMRIMMKGIVFKIRRENMETAV